MLIYLMKKNLIIQEIVKKYKFKKIYNNYCATKLNMLICLSDNFVKKYRKML